MKSRPSEKNHPRFNKRSQTRDEPSDLKVKLDKGSGSQGGKTTFATCGNKHCGKCLFGTKNCFGCGKDGHKVSDCPTITTRGNKR